MASAGAALNWDVAESKIDRFNKPLQPMEAQTYGFKGFPEMHMMEPKRPLRHQPSADITTDVNRYFRKDSPPDWLPPPEPMQPRMQSPPRQQRRQSPPRQERENDFGQGKMDSPQLQLQGTLSPRYNTDQQMSRRKTPVIRDPLGELSYQEKQKKIEEHYQAEEDLAMAQRRREEQKMAKIQEQRRIRELQDSYKPWGRPGGGAPNRIRKMQDDFHPYGLPGGGAPTMKAMIEAGTYHPYGKPGGGAPGADNRKMRFTEHQMNRPPSPKYNGSGPETGITDDMYSNQDPMEPRFGDENRGMDGVRSSMEQRHDMPGRKEDFGRASTMPIRPYSDSFRGKNDLLRLQEGEIEDLRRNLARLERDRHGDNTSRGPRADSRNDKMENRNEKLSEMLEEQAKQLKHVQDELSRLRAQDDMSYGAPRGMPDYNPRAQSDERYYPDFEPQTDRPYRANRDRAYFGQSDQRVPDYLNVSPRRKPDRSVGQLYNKDSTYKTDFDLPTVRHGNHNLGNPNKELWEPFSPFGLEGGGAPMVDSSGQRKTRIAGSMGILGREASDSARARKARGHKKEMLDTISAQAANDRLRKEYEKESRRQQYCELSDVMRQQKVGYPKYKPSGIIDNHHLPHMFETGPVVKPSEKKELYDYLTKQVNEKYMHDQLGTMEGRRQAIEHYKTQDRFFGRRGGGNIKGDDLRKVNLDRAIHNPTSTSRYYNKVRLEEELSPPEILDKFKPRITINSTHKNLYEFPEGNLKMNYQGRSPYAEF